MEITFVHRCPVCRRHWQLAIADLGRQVRCDDCGRLATARDPELESAALLDSMKYHAELSRFSTGEVKRWQTPR